MLCSLAPLPLPLLRTEGCRTKVSRMRCNILKYLSLLQNLWQTNFFPSHKNQEFISTRILQFRTQAYDSYRQNTLFLQFNFYLTRAHRRYDSYKKNVSFLEIRFLLDSRTSNCLYRLLETGMLWSSQHVH